MNPNESEFSAGDPSAFSMTRDEVRDVDRRAIQEYGMPGIVLMENAGRNTAELLCSLGISGRVVICSGKGNNGGDGFVIARHLENRGHEVQLLLFCAANELQGDAAVNCQIVQRAGTSFVENAQKLSSAELTDCFQNANWIVDALLGTGTRGEVREPVASVIPLVNQARKKVLAVDLPSGLDCETGKSLGACIRAQHTATFVARKRGFDHPSSVQWTGKVHVIDIGVPRHLLRTMIQD